MKPRGTSGGGAVGGRSSRFIRVPGQPERPLLLAS
jgi:hypothetical protein